VALRCEDVIFRGRVQGVGFRFTTCTVARRFRVGGWVRNEPDGTVHCVVEGEAGEIDRFIDAVRDAMSGNVTEVERQPVADGDAGGAGGFDKFDIRY